MTKFIDLTGQTFGRLTCLRITGRTNQYGGCAVWACRCTCGAEIEVPQVKLVRGYDACDACRAAGNPCCICGGPCPIGVGARKICSPACRTEYARRKAHESYVRNKERVLERTAARNKRLRAEGNPKVRELDRRKYAKTKADPAKLAEARRKHREWYAANKARILAARAAKRGEPLTHTCLNCQREFRTRRTNAVYCSRSCRNQHYERKPSNDMLTRDCAQCGKSFVAGASKRLTCSDECHRVRRLHQADARRQAGALLQLEEAAADLHETATQSDAEAIPCPHCKRPFLPVVRQSKRPRRYCSDTCKHEAREAKLAARHRQCVMCQKDFFAVKSTQYTCSKICRDERHRQQELRRIHAGERASGTATRTCHECGVEFVGHPNARYCGQECIQKARERVAQQRANRNYRCRVCDADMSSLNLKTHRYTCSDACRVELYRRKNERNKKRTP